jgi:hypothetical protein
MRNTVVQRAFSLFLGFAAVAAVAVPAAGAAKSARDVAIAALADAKVIYEKVCQASPQPRATILPAAVEVRLSRALAVTSDILAKSDDRELMAALIDYTSVSECSADRDRALALARIFRAKAEPLSASIAALPPVVRCKVVAQLQWGWTNDFLPAPTTPGAGADREARLTALKRSVPTTCWQS